MAQCFHCKAESTPEHYQRVVHNHVALYGPWRGWRMAGRVLVSPDGDRITPERLRGILFGGEIPDPETARAGSASNGCFTSCRRSPGTGAIRGRGLAERPGYRPPLASGHELA